MRWRTFSLAVGGVLLSTQICEAQTEGRGYVVCGAGGYANQFASGRVNQLAIGGEAVTAQQVGIGGEFGLGIGGGDAWFTLSLERDSLPSSESHEPGKPLLSRPGIPD